MDMKEKLVELIQGNTDGFVNPYAYEYSENAEQFADYLIANGIGFVTDNNVGSKWISVKDERKPKDRKNYFIAYVFGDSDIPFFGEAKYNAYEGNGIVDRPHFSNEGVDGMRVTNWMEIPKLPQPAEEETQADCTYNKNGHCMGQKLMPECDAKNCDRRK